MKNKDIIYIFVILVIFFYFKNEIFNLKKEKFTNNDTDQITKNIREEVNKKYNIDIDAIRNLSDVATELQKGGLTVPGDLTITGKLTVEKDSVTNGNSNVNGDLVFGGGNNWILNPSKDSSTLRIAPSKTAGKTDWDFTKEVNLDQGNINVTGHSTVYGNSNVNGDLVFGGGNNWILKPSKDSSTLRIAPSKTAGKTDWDFTKEVNLDQGNINVTGSSTVYGNSNVNGDLVFGGGNNWIISPPQDDIRTLRITPSKTAGKTDWDFEKGTDFLNTGGIEVTKFRPKVGKYIDNINCGLNILSGDDRKGKSKALFEKAGAQFGDIVPTIFNRDGCTSHWHRGGLMSKTAKKDGNKIVGTFTDFQYVKGEVLKDGPDSKDDWKWT